MRWPRLRWRPDNGLTALFKAASLVLSGLLLAGCAAPPQALPAPQPTACARLQWLGSTTIARDEPIHGATTGGISGLNYDARRGDFVAIPVASSSVKSAAGFRLPVVTWVK